MVKDAPDGSSATRRMAETAASPARMAIPIAKSPSDQDSTASESNLSR